MQTNWPEDINIMHDKFGVHDAVDELSPNLLKAFLDFRYNFLVEELGETKTKGIDLGDPEEIVDGLIDLCVVAIGTLDAFGVDAQEAWQRVLKANMAKEAGIKPERPNKFGLPDMIKPEGWVGPNHEGNYGLLTKVNYDWKDED